MTLSKVELMERDRPRRPIDVAELVEGVRASQEARATAAGVRLELALPAALPEIPGDPDQLHQVLVNLVDNALKYGAAGERIELRACHHASAPPRAGRLAGLAVVALEVVDHGEGIPPEAIPRITERFFRVDTSRSRRLGGTGLGLAIVKHIVSRHRGHLAVESVLGEGSRFAIFLALDPEA
jgi:two-component system phosphate regulon sensor histidine kinase PhoR